MPTFNSAATLIALRALPALAGRSFSPGDAVPWRDLEVKERTVGQLIQMRKLGELTQDNFNFALKQRRDGALPQGFTADGLAALGITIPEAAAAAPREDEVTLTYDSEEVRQGYTVKGLKVSRAMRYDVFDAAGGRLNPGGPLTSLKTVDKFIAQLEAEKARIAAPTAAEILADDPNTAALVELVPDDDGDGEGYGDEPPPSEGA